MVFPLQPMFPPMSKDYPSWMFRKFQNFQFCSSLSSFIRIFLLFSLIYTQAEGLIFLPSRFSLPSPAFAQTSTNKTDSKVSHRLENFLISTEDRDDWTRLMLAILNSVPAVEQVLAQGVSVNIRGTEEFHGVTPLIFASGIGSLVIVKLLVEKGARLNDTDTQGNTALIQAAKKGHFDTLQYLLLQGANPNAETNQKWKALMFAAHRGQFEVLKTLLKHGANADFQDDLGMSSMMSAAQNGHFEIV